MVRPRASLDIGATSLALVALLALAGPAGAHALPQSSSPSPGSSLSTPPARVTITFGERPDPKLSSINVLDSNGSPVTAGPTAASSGDPLTLEVPLRPLVDGVYTVAWRTVSAVDGHRASGSFAFGVGTAPSASGGSSNSVAQTSSSGPSPPAIAGRWLLYIGLLVLLGASFFGVVVARVPAPIVGRLLASAWVLAAVGTAVVIVDELAEAGVDVGQVSGTSFGPGIVERVVPIVVAGMAIVLGARSVARYRLVLTIVALAAAGALLADVLASHAAAGQHPALDVVVQSIHVGAVGLWMGGLLGLLVAIRHRPPDAATAKAAKRFSWVATVGIVAVAFSGLLRGISEVGTIDALFSTDFGRLLIGKTALLAVLAALGATNHFRNVPAAGRVLTGLRRVGSVEIVVGATVVLLAAALVNVAPPASIAASGATPAPSPSQQPIVVSGSDFGTSVRLRLEVSPGLTGFNTFRAIVTDYDTAAPVAADGVTLRFSVPARSDIGSSRLDLAPVGAGVFSATGGNLSIDGPWQIIALVARGTSSVEVPLAVVAQATRPEVDVNRVAGIPTIYTVHLTTGRTVQVYLDPDRPGQNDVHVTFFDASGSELPATNIGVSVTTGTTGPRQLTVRTLEPGHVVATLTTQNLPQVFEIRGTAPGGEELLAQLVVTPGS
jgi:copper transport protein